MSYELIWGNGGLVEKYRGAFTGTEMTRVNEIVAADSRFDDLRWIIADLTEAQVVEDVSKYFEEAAAMSYAASLTNDRMVIAVVTPSALAAERANNFKLFNPPFPYEVFSTFAEAYEWVDRVCLAR